MELPDQKKTSLKREKDEKMRVVAGVKERKETVTKQAICMSVRKLPRPGYEDVLRDLTWKTMQRIIILLHYWSKKRNQRGWIERCGYVETR